MIRHRSFLLRHQKSPPARCARTGSSRSCLVVGRGRSTGPLPENDPCRTRAYSPRPRRQRTRLARPGSSSSTNSHASPKRSRSGPPAPGRRAARSRSGRRRRRWIPSSRAACSARLLRLAGEERVVALVRGRGEVVPARRRSTTATRSIWLRSLRRRRAAPGRRASRDAGGELVDGDGRRGGRRRRRRRTGRSDVDSELAGEQRVVADLRVGVEREVVGGERDVGVEERLQPAAQPRGRRRSGSLPQKQAVVDEHELGAGPRRALEELERRRDAADDRRHLVARRRPGAPAARTPGSASRSSSSSAKARISSRALPSARESTSRTVARP